MSKKKKRDLDDLDEAIEMLAHHRANIALGQVAANALIEMVPKDEKASGLLIDLSAAMGKSLGFIEAVILLLRDIRRGA